MGGFAKQFSKHAVFVFRGRTITVVDDLINWSKNRRSDLQDKQIQTRHINTNIVLNRVTDSHVIGKNTLLVTWYYKNEKKTVIKFTGTYDVEFKKTNSGWKISKRTFKTDQHST